MWLVYAALGSVSVGPAADPTTVEDGTVESYIAAAVADHPRILADRHASDAAEERIAGQRALPEPRVSVRGFVQPVETRVGSQQMRLGVRQSIPWQTRLVQADMVAPSDAEPAEWLVACKQREVAARFEADYWTLWRIGAERALHQDHLAIRDGLSSTVRARIEVGAAPLADLCMLAQFGLLHRRDVYGNEQRRGLAASHRVVMGQLHPNARNPTRAGVVDRSSIVGTFLSGLGDSVFK